MTIIRIGATKKYSDNWDSIFGGKRGAKSSTVAVKDKPKPTTKKSAAKKKSAAPKKAVKKKAKRK